MHDEETHSKPDPELIEALEVALRTILPPLLDDVVREQLASMALGEDLPIDLKEAVKILPFGDKTLRRLRHKKKFRMLKLPEVDKPFTTIGAIRALIRQSKFEDE